MGFVDTRPPETRQSESSLAEPILAAVLAAAPYRRRPLRFIGRERLGDWRIKVYGIALPGRAPRPELVEATLSLAAEALPRPAVAEDRYGAGFVIAHDAMESCIGLVYWWEQLNELHQRVFVGPKDRPDGMTALRHPAAGCVWELGILDFERRAWVEDVLANPAGPDLDRYFTRRLDADF